MSLLSNIEVYSTASKKYIIILVCLCIVVPLILGGWIFYGPKTIREVYVNWDNKKGTFTFYKDGDEVSLYGKITGIKYYNTTYGNYSLLTLDGTSNNDVWYPIGVFVHSKSSYHVGDSFSITLHFKKYHYNNDTMIAAEELYTPLYSNIFNLEDLVRGIGLVGGITLVPMPIANVMEYTIYLPKDSQRSGYPLDLFSLTLGKGSHYGAKDMMDLQPVGTGEGGNYIGGIVDEYENLSGPSLNGIVQFKDVVNPGMLDTGDKIILNLPPTTNNYKFDSYILSFKTRNNLLGGAAYFVNGHLGVLDYPSGGLLNHVQLSMVNETKLNGNWNDIFRVVDVPEALAPYHNKIDRYKLSLISEGIPFCYEGNSVGPVALKDGLVCQGGTSQENSIVTYRDVNHNGIVDSPDEIIVNWPDIYGIPEILLSTPDGNTVGSILWIRGLGVISGFGYYIKYIVARTMLNNVTINISKIYGNPGIQLTNFSGPNQFRAELLEDNSGVFNETMVNGMIGQSGNTSLSFMDHDGNGYINAGDQFNVTCRAGKNYTLRLSSYDIFKSIDIDWKT